MSEKKIAMLTSLEEAEKPEYAVGQAQRARGAVRPAESGQPWREVFAQLQRDIDRYEFLGERSRWGMILTSPGIWLVAQYRFSRWVKYSFHVPVVRQVLRFVAFSLWQLLRLTLNSELPNSAVIGEGLLLPHPYGIVLHKHAVIGRYCDLGQEVTIGVGGRRDRSGVPELGDRVYVAPGAKLFGKITVGDRVAIGANAVVNKSLPDYAVAVGIPAKVISHAGSQDIISFPDTLLDQKVSIESGHEAS